MTQTAPFEVIEGDNVTGALVDAGFYIRALGDGFGDLETCIAGIRRVFAERKMHGPHADLLFDQLIRTATAVNESRPARRRGQPPRPEWIRSEIRRLLKQVVKPQRELLIKAHNENTERIVKGRRARGGDPIPGRKLTPRSTPAKCELQTKRDPRLPEKYQLVMDDWPHSLPDRFQQLLDDWPHFFRAYGITSPTTIKSILHDKRGRDSRRKSPPKNSA
jgi:hypothetical protein